MPEASSKIEDSFFQTPIFQALTIGVPFCIFKLLLGTLCVRVGTEQQSGLLVFSGWAITAWASADLAMNLTRVFFYIAGRRSPVEYCTIAQVGRLFKRPQLFLAIDTFVSFFIICFALWSGWITRLNPIESYLWYGATTLNLISLSMVNIWLELKRGS
ncbi:MAG: hypothetical protein A4E48_00175 [Methanosaeta sp. PtaU1.Bin060]|jgi:hypothetical protein|nr:MAG: hypothetical protein A4E48_00175 [Methanosaeta sp. PtaU1.Bin060]